MHEKVDNTRSSSNSTKNRVLSWLIDKWFVGSGFLVVMMVVDLITNIAAQPLVTLTDVMVVNWVLTFLLLLSPIGGIAGCCLLVIFRILEILVSLFGP